MFPRRPVWASCLTAVAVATLALAAGTTPAAAAGPAAQVGSACATLKLTARPPVNAQNAPNETVRNIVTSCATGTETVTLTQTIIGPFAAMNQSGRTWAILLVTGQSLDKIQHIPYACCGTYTILDQVRSPSGRVLAQRRTSFTFA